VGDCDIIATVCAEASSKARFDHTVFFSEISLLLTTVGVNTYPDIYQTPPDV